MSAKRLSRREFLSLAGAASGAALLAACAPKATETPEPEVEATPVPEVEPVKIVFDAGVATPHEPDAELAPGEARKVAMQHIIDEYMELHPDVEIELYRFIGGGFEEKEPWMVARMTAKDIPDIFALDQVFVRPYIGQGWFQSFDDWFDLPNPYVEGNEAWRDMFKESALLVQVGPDGHIYGLSFDGASILLAYNNDMFTEAGIDGEPRTWNEFIQTCQKLADAGYTPFVARPDFLFSLMVIVTQLMGDDYLEFDDDGNKEISANEAVKYSQLGKFPPWDVYLKQWQLMKELAQFFPPGFEGELDYQQLFRAAEVAMTPTGIWTLPEYKASPVPFEMGWMDFPVITKDIWPNSPEETVRIETAGGGELQWRVAAYVVEEQPEKAAVIRDFLMFISQPKHVGALCAETGMLPMIQGAQGFPEQAPFMEPFDRLSLLAIFDILGSSARQEEKKIGQQYLPTDMSDDELLALAQETWEVEVEKVLELNPDWRIE